MLSANILLVDDRKENLLALEAMLEGLVDNLHFIRARSGEEALECVQNQDFAVILLDVVLPGISGLETATRIKAREGSQHTPIIFLTAFEVGELPIFKGYSSGAVDYLVKPINPEVLRAKVATFVELSLTHERLREMERLKSKFIADASHELRTPLASLELRLYLLEHDATDKQSQHIEVLKRSVNQLQDIVNGILRFSEFQEDDNRQRFTTVDLNTLVAQVVAGCHLRAEAAGLNVRTQLADMRLPLWGNPKYLSQALTELLVNAITYTENGGVDLITELDRDRNVVCLTIQDTGIGIAEDDLPYIFERFYRGQQVSSSTFPGTGLGLSSVQEIVHLHGGTINVESQIGQGTSFRLSLPLKRVAHNIAESLPGEA